ncbi:MAG TPA: MarR family transcriptional regulator [Bacteroidia bacterium]|nr:MarR family transcriptional regulator [Bacteroidia bacterium]
MSLEDDIQQRTFRTQHHKLAVNLLYTTSWLNSHYSEFFKNSGLSLQQFNVLRILRGQNGKACSLKLIKERMLDRMSDASRIVDKLVAKGLVKRETSADDRRSVNLMITEKGLDTLRKMDVIDDSVKELFKNLNESQLRGLNDLLDQLRGSRKKN